METIPVILEVVMTVLLAITYYKLCTHRDIPKWGKIAEIVALYSASAWALLGNLKFYVWALMIAVIGMIKILTTKKHKIERRDKGYTN